MKAEVSMTRRITQSMAGGASDRMPVPGRRRFLASLTGFLILPALFVFSKSPYAKPTDGVVIVNGWFLNSGDLDGNAKLARLIAMATEFGND